MSKVWIRFTVNGIARSIETFPMARLLDVIREDLELTGTKEGCGEGECGACSVLVDGELVNSCLIPVVQTAGAEVTTIEGLEERDRFPALRDSFLQAGGAQCGICTPGMMMASWRLLERVARPTRAEIREALAGNLCRCTGYQKIVDAVEAAV